MDYNNPYSEHYRSLVRAIESGDAPYPGDEEGIKDVRVILTAYASAATGEEIIFKKDEWTFY